MKSAKSPAQSGLLSLSRVGGRTLTLSALVIMALILGNLALLYSSLNTVREHNRLITQTHDILYDLDLTLAALKNAENNTRTSSCPAGLSEAFAPSFDSSGH